MLQLSSGMCIELVMVQRRKRALVDLNQSGEPMSPQEANAARRAYLGCYYLSSVYGQYFTLCASRLLTACSFSVANYWPSLLDYNDCTAECARHLRDHPERPSDLLAERLVALQSLYDNLHAVFRPFGLSSGDNCADGVRFHLSAVLSSLQKWKADIPPELDSNHHLLLSYQFILMELHNGAVRLLSTTKENSTIPVTVETMSRDILLGSLRASKDFMAQLLDIESPNLASVSFCEWMRLPYVLILAANLCFPSDGFRLISWDIKIAQESLRLDVQLEHLCAKIHGLALNSSCVPNQSMFFILLTKVLQCTMRWYRCRTEEQPGEKSASVDTSDSPLKNLCSTAEEELTSEYATPANKSVEELDLSSLLDDMTQDALFDQLWFPDNMSLFDPLVYPAVDL